MSDIDTPHASNREKSSLSLFLSHLANNLLLLLCFDITMGGKCVRIVYAPFMFPPRTANKTIKICIKFVQRVLGKGAPVCANPCIQVPENVARQLIRKSARSSVSVCRQPGKMATKHFVLAQRNEGSAKILSTTKDERRPRGSQM